MSTIPTNRADPTDILHRAITRASADLTQPLVHDLTILNRIETVCRFQNNRACARFLLACTLAKSHRPAIDIRQPYTEIGSANAYSGRTYDERYINPFVIEHKLPCNSTTAFLTPAFRNRNIVLTPDVNLVGRPPKLYQTALQLLTDIHEGKVTAEDMLTEMTRQLLVIRDENLLQLETMLSNLRSSEGLVPLSSEAIVTLIEQHLKCKNMSRLPVLVVAAAYQTASTHLGERVLQLEAHNAADEQTGSSGDVQIALTDDNEVITVYEMKARRVIPDDIDRALQKLRRRIDNYIFITTEEISDQVKDYAASIYEKTGGIEFVVLDCISFIRHFLHLFHRLRIQYLDAYQDLVIAEPESAVRQELKEAFLALRLAAEKANAFDENASDNGMPQDLWSQQD
jgi:hypothetical protein